MTTQEAKQLNALHQIMRAIVETVKAAGKPFGAPGGHLYAALSGILNIDQFTQIMGVLVKEGFVTKRGECYHWVRDF